MTRMEIWAGERDLADRIVARIKKWDPDGEVAKNLKIEKRPKKQVAVVATFNSKGDGQDAGAYADGYIDGFSDGIIAADPEDPDDPETEEDPDLEEEEEEEEEETE